MVTTTEESTINQNVDANVSIEEDGSKLLFHKSTLGWFDEPLDLFYTTESHLEVFDYTDETVDPFFDEAFEEENNAAEEIEIELGEECSLVTETVEELTRDLVLEKFLSQL